VRIRLSHGFNQVHSCCACTCTDLLQESEKGNRNFKMKIAIANPLWQNDGNTHHYYNHSMSSKFRVILENKWWAWVFLYLFSSANISPVRFVLHLKNWWCVRKRETSFPVNKLWLIYLQPSLWPLTMKNRYACKFWSSQKNESRKQADSSEAYRKAKACLLSSIRWENPCHYCFPQMLTFTERTMKKEKGELMNCHTIKEVVFGTRNN